MPHDKAGRAIERGDWIRYNALGFGPDRLGVVYEIAEGTDMCNLRAVAAVVTVATHGAVFMPAMLLPQYPGANLHAALLVESGWLTACDVELVAKATGALVPLPVSAESLVNPVPFLREFLAFLARIEPCLAEAPPERKAVLLELFLKDGQTSPVAPVSPSV